MLNTGKGHAVRGPRCQSDRHLYREAITADVRAAPNSGGRRGRGRASSSSERRDTVVRGVRLADGREIEAAAVVVTTGTFLRAVMHTGERRAPAVGPARRRRRASRARWRSSGSCSAA
jgi:tRNA uridine 5-carboxymethylaminomethyl modification enzyme